ncbi:MAG: Crp/Fnr family transcriptional regulator [Alphaproteobacteria bacterium]
MTEQCFAAGETIFREGDPADYAYLIHSGRVEIIKETGEGPVRLAFLGEGDMFGEMGVLDERPRSATARACEPVVASAIDQNAFLTMLVCRPRDSLAVLRAVFERLRSMNQWVAGLASPHAAGPWVAQVALRAIAPGTGEALASDEPLGAFAASTAGRRSVNGTAELAAANGSKRAGAAGRFTLEVGPEGVSVRNLSGASAALVNGTRIDGCAAAALHAGANEVVAFGAGAPARYRSVIEAADDEACKAATRH